MFAQSQRQTVYHATADCHVQSFNPVTGGGNVLTGYSRYGTDSAQINLIFLNDSDVIVSHKEFNTATEFDFASTLLPVNNGFLIGGKSSDPSYFHPQLIKTDLSGNVLWAKYFDNTSFWQGQIIRILPNGNNFSMYTYAEIPFNDFYRIETDINGSSFSGWQYTADTSAVVRVMDTEAFPNSSSHILGGHANFNSATTRGGMLMKTNQSGIQWTKHITAGGNFKNDVVDVLTSADGFAYGVFVCENLPGNQYSTIILKFDSLGNKIWAKQLAVNNGTVNGCSIIESSAHDFYVASYDNQFNTYICKLTSAGNLSWTHRWTASSAAAASDLKLFRDAAGNIVLTGGIDSSYFVARLDADANGCSFINSTAITASNANLTLINIPFITTAFSPNAVNEPVNTSFMSYSESMICGGVGVDQIETEPLLVVYPNPVIDKFTIQKSQITSATATEILIYNLMGEKMFERSFSATEQEMKMDVSQLSPGIYFICMTAGEKIFFEKFIKE
jgi:hypothetical protein